VVDSESLILEWRLIIFRHEINKKTPWLVGRVDAVFGGGDYANNPTGR